LSRRSSLVEPTHGLSMTPTRLELRLPAAGPFSRPATVAFDGQLGTVASGRHQVCNIGAVIEVEASDWGDGSALRLVFVDADDKEQRHTLARNLNDIAEIRDAINGWLRTYNH